MNPMTEAPEELVAFSAPEEATVERSVADGRARLQALIAGEAIPATARRRRPGRVLAVVAALACAALIAGLVAGISSDEQPDRMAAVSDVAKRVEGLPDPTALGLKDHLYTDTRFWARVSMNYEEFNRKPSSKPWIQIENVRIETWISPRGGLQSKMTPEAIQLSYPTARDRALAEAAPSSNILGAPLPLVDDSHPARVFTVGDSHLDYAALRALPDDTAAMEAKLANFSKPDGIAGGTARSMRAAQALLQYPIRSEVRAAIYRVIATFPDVKARTGVKDAMNRVGTSVTWVDGAYRRELVFDPDTGVDLELRLYEIDPQRNDPESRIKPGEMVERDTIVARGVVDRADGVVLSEDYTGRD